jgi:pilus assembly protein CpaE
MENKLLVTIAVKDQETRATLKSLFGEMDDVSLVAASDGKAAGLVIREVAAPGGNGDLARAMAAAARLQDRDEVEEVFVLSSRLDQELLLQAMRSGIRELMPLPLDQEEFTQALDRFRKRRTSGRSTNKALIGRIIDVIGCKGGVGATTVAVNLAMNLLGSNNGKGRAKGAKPPTVALLDMNLAFGDVPLFLDIEPLYTWGEIIRNIDRLDATFLMSVMSRHPSGLYVLPAPNRLTENVDLSTQALEKLFDLMRQVFDFTVVDGGGYHDEVSFSAMALSGQVLLVSTLSLPCLANMKKLEDVLGHLGSIPLDSVKLVVNRHMSDAEISVRDAERITGRETFHLIPNDYSATMSAINQGRPLCEAFPKSPSAKALKAMTETLAGNQRRAPGNKGSLLSFPWNLFSKSATA